MYLTRITLNPTSRDARRDLRSSRDMHRTLMKLVPDKLGPSPRAASGLLWRLDHNGTSLRLLVQTRRSPMIDRLPAGYGTAASRDLDPLVDWVADGCTVNYRIAINAAKVQNGTGKRVAVPSGEMNEWWERRSRRAGFSDLTPARVTHEPSQRMRDQFVTAVARIDGTARVVDATATKAALHTGIGRARAWGCGLLTIARVSDA